jgi:glycosyltransferase involved in cell wall biosynthesis
MTVSIDISTEKTDAESIVDAVHARHDKMRILFIHQNFPGQFVHLARALAKLGHEVRAVADAASKQTKIVPTRTYNADSHANAIRQAPLLSRNVTDCALRGAAVAQELHALRLDGFVPDLVIGHPGWGETLFVKDVFERTKLVVFAEYYHDADGADSDFDPEFPRLDAQRRYRLRMRNATTLLALASADAAVAPTKWQAGRFPPEIRSKISIIHEGIDTDAVAPGSRASLKFARDTMALRAGQEVVTFASRNLEPYRGYHVFMRALPEILRARPKAHAVIVGGDSVSYGPAPGRGRTWKSIFLDEVRDRLPMDRIHFVGRLKREHFIKMLQISSAHVYLTYPFVLSWSMLEAMSAGALVVGSRTPPVEEVIADRIDGALVGFFDHQALAAKVIEANASPEDFLAIRQAARAKIVNQYDLRRRGLPLWFNLIEKVTGQSPVLSPGVRTKQ